ncbi:MAG: L,D-transpeptidase, partial [Mycobacterium sp.]
MTRQRLCRLWLAALMIPLAVLGAGACSGGGGTTPPKVIMDKGTPFGDLLVPKLSASVTDGAVGVAVDSPVTVSADDGVLASVTVVNENGRSVDGQLSPDGVRWSSTEPLGYNRRYTLTAKARGLGGVATRQMTFQTHSPQNLTMPYVMPHDGEVVGVGEPVAIRFDENIANRAAAEKAIVVTTDPPVVGAFYWLNNREARWRPEHFWKPGTTVNVEVNTYGVDLGDGVFGEDNLKTHFTIGDELIATADDTTKMVTVRINGEVAKTMPTSMGKDSTPTASGIYMIGERFAHMIMDSSTYGVPVNSPNGYRTEVDFATQMSYGGVFIHSAP